MLQCTADTLADAVLITTAHAWQHQGKTLFISRKTYRIDGSGQMAITVDVEVASDTPHPARIGLNCQLAQVAERVNWLGLGPQENYPDRLTAACFDRWDLPLSDMYTPYVFPSENGLRCGTRELNYGPHQWRGDFQFNISRYSQQQLMETSHRHLLHAEEGTWLNIDGFHMGIGGDDSEPVSIGGIPAERRSLPLPVGLVSKIIITGQAMSARISRKEIHYVLFKKHKLLDVRFILFLLLFIMGAYFPFFPIWLHDINHISKSDTGIIFAAISLFSLLFQPLFGLLSDKLGLRKYLLWIITGMLVMFAPFFIFIFGPLLQYNILVGSIVGGIYLGFCFNAGAPAVEAFIEKVSRRSNFEFGRARMFGCVGWALCASIVGIMFTINNQFVFWLGSGCALILAVLLFFAKTDAPSSATVANAVGANHSAFSLKLALELFRQPKLWFLSLYVIGVSCTYDVFDQQFANFFTSFFATGEQGTRVFGYVTTMGELLNASIMFFAPLIINRIGGKNALLLAGTIMSVRIIGSSFATSALEVVILKTLHMFEVPFLLVGCFKYITSQFEVRFSATIYLVCFCFFKQLAMIFMSVLAGNMYESIGFRGAYLVLGLVALGFTLISVFTLSGPGPLSLLRRQVNEVA